MLLHCVTWFIVTKLVEIDLGPNSYTGTGTGIATATASAPPPVRLYE